MTGGPHREAPRAPADDAPTTPAAGPEAQGADHRTQGGSGGRARTRIGGS